MACTSWMRGERADWRRSNKLCTATSLNEERLDRSCLVTLRISSIQSGPSSRDFRLRFLISFGIRQRFSTPIGSITAFKIPYRGGTGGTSKLTWIFARIVRHAKGNVRFPVSRSRTAMNRIRSAGWLGSISIWLNACTAVSVPRFAQPGPFVTRKSSKELVTIPSQWHDTLFWNPPWLPSNPPRAVKRTRHWLEKLKSARTTWTFSRNRNDTQRFQPR